MYQCLLNSHADLSIQGTTYAIINEFHELVIEYYFTDDDRPSSDITWLATVDRKETSLLAKRLNVKVQDLPKRIYDECGVPYDSVPSHAEQVFQEALEFILDNGVQYTLKETRP